MCLYEVRRLADRIVHCNGCRTVRSAIRTISASRPTAEIVAAVRRCVDLNLLSGIVPITLRADSSARSGIHRQIILSREIRQIRCVVGCWRNGARKLRIPVVPIRKIVSRVTVNLRRSRFDGVA